MSAVNGMYCALVYTSTAVHRFSANELEGLLDVARANNSRLDVSGMLLYREGSFMQLLEGEQSTVEMLFDKITADPRHVGMTVVSKQFIAERSFPAWSMGFRDLEQEFPIRGFSDFLTTRLPPSLVGATASEAQKLLLSFKHG